MRKKDIDAIKEQIKRERKEKAKDKYRNLEPDIVFWNKMAAWLICRDLHMHTIYKMIKIKHMDQMLDTMWDNTIKELNLHEPTVRRMMDRTEKEEVEKAIEEKVGKKMKIQI